MSDSFGRQHVQGVSPFGIVLEVCQVGTRPEPPCAEAATEVWRDVQGMVCARSSMHDGFTWVDVSGVGLFRFALASRKVTAFPNAGASPDLTHDTYLRVVLPIGLSYCGYEVLHASAVLTEKGVIGFCAASGTGKSTLAAAFCRKGYAVFADDALVLDFDAAAPAVTAVPVPFSLRLKDDAHPPLGPAGRRCPEASSPLAALCVLERGELPVDAPEAIRLSPIEAFSAILPHTYHASLSDSGRKKEILSQHLELVGQVPVFKVTFAADFSFLPRLTHVVEETIAAADLGAGKADPSLRSR
jgi:hypothetical protein